MDISFGFATLVALLIGIGLPVLVSLSIWVVQWLRIIKFLYWTKATGDEKPDLPRSLILVLFGGQYYSFILLQPLDWARPWVLLLLLFTFPVGVLIDSGYVVAYFTVGAVSLAIVGCISGLWYFSNSPRFVWWLEAPLVVLWLVMAMFLGILVDNWIV